ncbi:MAG TPA: Re/Si-specific NAD(P)(+) transhydrogenase subunit alpha [Acidimicrobiia bacterium]|nr:Re/Si-specific NAD(P)(+) transhydrogenase subunit alpha [Acidimicrobiia bacterium]
MGDLRVGVPRETFTGERRVALTPAVVAELGKAGIQAIVEFGAGQSAGFTDEAYAEAGAKVVRFRNEVFAADVVLRVRAVPADVEAARQDLERLRPDQVVIGMCDPLSNPEAVAAMAASKIALFAMDLIPRITRAQSMDALSSQATVAGYKAVVLAAGALPKMFPMLTTAAGTVPPAHVFIVGAGVAGLQAIATAKRLGAVVHAFDVRPDVKEQVQSVGAKFVELELETSESQDTGGYAKAMDEDFYRRQQEMMARVVAGSDVVITTAAIPGRPAPRLVSAEMVAGMQPGSVIVDLAAERGGNCELTRRDEVVTEHGVTIFGPTNLPATAPYQASSMYAKNISAFLRHVAKDGALNFDLEDQITRDTLLAMGGGVVHPLIRKALGFDEESEGAVASR